MARNSALTASLVAAAALWAASPELRLADAAQKMDRAAIRALLDRHAGVNEPQADGTTALHWAARQDDVETVRLLLGAGANAKAVNRYGVTVSLVNARRADAAAPESHAFRHGIPGMRERAQLAGGTLRVEAGADGQFRVTARIPAQTGRPA